MIYVTQSLSSCPKYAVAILLPYRSKFQLLTEDIGEALSEIFHVRGPERGCAVIFGRHSKIITNCYNGLFKPSSFTCSARSFAGYLAASCFRLEDIDQKAV